LKELPYLSSLPSIEVKSQFTRLVPHFTFPPFKLYSSYIEREKKLGEEK